VKWFVQVAPKLVQHMAIRESLRMTSFPMQEFRYNSDLSGGSLLVRESRVIADLLLNNATDSEWHQAVHLDNRLQKRSPATAKRLAGMLRKRLERLAPAFLQALRDGDDELTTQLAFVAALDRNLLLVEFMETVVRDAFVVRTEALARYQWLDFPEDRAFRDPSIADLAEISKKKIGQVVSRMLAEVGLLQSTRSLKLQYIVVRPEVNSLLNSSHRDRIRACLNVSSANPAE
jgi:hypothetical protein